MDKRTATKTARLLSLLKTGWVTPLECLEQTGLMTLSQRVSDFRARGVNVVDRWVILPSGARVKAYRIVSRAWRATAKPQSAGCSLASVKELWLAGTSGPV